MDPTSPTVPFGQALAPPLDVRLARLEQTVAGLRDEVAALRALLGADGERPAVATVADVEEAVAETRRMVSALGRLIVRDVGQLPKMMTELREALLEGPTAPPASDETSGS